MDGTQTRQGAKSAPICTIKRATVDDIDKLLSIREEATRNIFGLGDDDDLSDVMENTEAYYRRTIPAGKHVTGLVMQGDEVIGCGGIRLYQELPAPTNPTGKCAFVMNVYIAPKARRQGLGHKLMTWLIDEAKARGACKIYLEASDSGAPLYASLGFRPMGGMMRLEDDFVHKGDAMHTVSRD